MFICFSFLIELNVLAECINVRSAEIDVMLRQTARGDREQIVTKTNEENTGSSDSFGCWQNQLASVWCAKFSEIYLVQNEFFGEQTRNEKSRVSEWRKTT